MEKTTKRSVAFPDFLQFDGTTGNPGSVSTDCETPLGGACGSSQPDGHECELRAENQFDREPIQRSSGGPMGNCEHQRKQHHEACQGRTLAVSPRGENDPGARRQMGRNPGREVSRDLGSRSGLESKKDPSVE